MKRNNNGGKIPLSTAHLSQRLWISTLTISVFHQDLLVAVPEKRSFLEALDSCQVTGDSTGAELIQIAYVIQFCPVIDSISDACSKSPEVRS